YLSCRGNDFGGFVTGAHCASSHWQSAFRSVAPGAPGCMPFAPLRGVAWMAGAVPQRHLLVEPAMVPLHRDSSCPRGLEGPKEKLLSTGSRPPRQSEH